MAAHGANAVRTYTVPPRWLLDAAGRHGLMVMVGIDSYQHVRVGVAVDVWGTVRFPQDRGGMDYKDRHAGEATSV